jgi:hypothetical protein
MLGAGLSMCEVANAGIPDAAGIIHGCYNSTNGSQRIIDTVLESCKKGEVPIQWNQVGIQGPQGPQGPQGAPGLPGTSQAYSADNSHVIDTKAAATQELVGVSGLPAGVYLVWATVSDMDFGQDDVVCDLTQNGNPIQVDDLGQSHFSVSVGTSATIVAAVSASTVTSFIVGCGRVEGIIGGPPVIAGRVIVLKIDALN